MLPLLPRCGRRLHLQPHLHLLHAPTQHLLLLQQLLLLLLLHLLLHNVLLLLLLLHLLLLHLLLLHPRVRHHPSHQLLLLLHLLLLLLLLLLLHPTPRHLLVVLLRPGAPDVLLNRHADRAPVILRPCATKCDYI